MRIDASTVTTLEDCDSEIVATLNLTLGGL